jgi:hypothetical protein
MVNEHYHVELQRVIYEKQPQVELLKLALNDVISTLEEKNILELWTSFGLEEKQLFIVSFNTFLQTMAANEIVRFKDPAFAEEKEWRLTARPTSIHLNFQEMQQLKFRTARGMAVPYVELRPKDGTLLPVAWIRYGPTLEKKRVMNSLELLVKQKGYSDMKFHGSEIPVALP